MNALGVGGEKEAFDKQIESVKIDFGLLRRRESEGNGRPVLTVYSSPNLVGWSAGSGKKEEEENVRTQESMMENRISTFVTQTGRKGRMGLGRNLKLDT